MKLQARSALMLKEALHRAGKCINNKCSMAIMENVLLKKEGNDFFFVSGNQDAILKQPAPFEIVEGDYNKEVVLPLKQLQALIATLPSDCVLTFDVGEGESHPLAIEYCITVDGKVKKGQVSLSYQMGEDYPPFATLSANPTHISLPGIVFKNAVENAVKFVAHDELRPVMNCLCIDIAEDLSQVVIVASDGHKLIKTIHTNNPDTGGSNFYRSGSPMRILINSTFFSALQVFFDCEDVEIEADEKFIRVSSGDMKMLMRGVDGKYPNYNSVIPRDNPYVLVVNKKEILEVLRRVALFCSESSKLISLHPDGMFLDMKGEDIDFSQSAEDQVLLLDNNAPDNFRIGFSYVSLMGAIAAIPGDTVKLNLSDPSHAGVVTENSANSLNLTLVMPMLLND